MIGKSFFTVENFFFGAIGLIVLSYFFYLPNEYTWYVESSDEYSALFFPDRNNSKNYELPVDMEITRINKGILGSSRYEYSISRADFSNGGYLEFDNCRPGHNSMTSCIDRNGKEWGVKVTTTPDEPESDPYE